MKTKLYIIGNGFDRAHGMKSSYNDFKNFLVAEKGENDILIRLIDEQEKKEPENNKKDGSVIWSSVEESLGEITFEEILRVNNENLEDYISDTIWDEDGEEIEILKEKPVKVDELIDNYKMVKYKFIDWAKGIELNRGSFRQSIYEELKKGDCYVLTFNYTNVMEELYGVSREDILYIHGSQSSEKDEIEFGHGVDVPSLCQMSGIGNAARFLMEQYEVNGELYLPNIDITKALRKDTEKIINQNKNVFEKYKDITDIFIFGLSFGKVDRPYLEKLTKDCPNANWHVNVYDFKTCKNLCETTKDLGIEKCCFWKEWEK